MLSISSLLFTTKDSNLVQDNLTNFGFDLYKIGKFNDGKKKFQTEPVLLGEDYPLLIEKGVKVYPYVYFYSSVYYNSFYNIDNNTLVFMEEFDNQFNLLSGSYPTTSYEVLISDYVAQVILKSEYFNDLSQIQDLIGKNFPTTINNYDFNLKISGVFSTNFEKYINSIENSSLAKELFKEKDNYFTSFMCLSSTFSDISQKVDYSLTYIKEVNGSTSEGFIMNINNHQNHILYRDESKPDGALITALYLMEQEGYIYDEIYENPDKIYNEIDKTITLTLLGRDVNFEITGIIDNISEEAPFVNSAIIALPSEHILDYTISAGLMLDLQNSKSLLAAQKQNFYIHTNISFFEKISTSYTIIRGVSLFISTVLLLSKTSGTTTVLIS